MPSFLFSFLPPSCQRLSRMHQQGVARVGKHIFLLKGERFVSPCASHSPGRDQFLHCAGPPVRPQDHIWGWPATFEPAHSCLRLRAEWNPWFSLEKKSLRSLLLFPHSHPPLSAPQFLWGIKSGWWRSVFLLILIEHGLRVSAESVSSLQVIPYRTSLKAIQLTFFVLNTLCVGHGG